jgi:hypothetical protein
VCLLHGHLRAPCEGGDLEEDQEVRLEADGHVERVIVVILHAEEGEGEAAGVLDTREGVLVGESEGGVRGGV